MRAIEAVTTPGETAALCQSVGVSRASLYRRRRPAPRSTPLRPRAPSSRALGATERQAVLDVLHSERFIDQSPAGSPCHVARGAAVPLCPAHDVSRARGGQGSPRAARPGPGIRRIPPPSSWRRARIRSGRGTSPNSRARSRTSTTRSTSSSDLFSRYAVGWMVARHENAHLAERLIAATCRKQSIAPHQLTIHADRGAPMRSTLVALLFSDLGIDASHSRPRVSNRQSVLRSAVPDREVPTGVSWPVRLARTRARHQPRSVRVVQRRAPSQRPELSDTRRRALRPRRDGPHGPAPHAPGGVRRPS